MTAQASQPAEGDVVKLPNAEARGAAQAAPPAAEPAPRKRGRRGVLMVSVPLVLLVAGGWFYLTGGRYEETDNAYVQQAKVALSADVAGRIVDVRIGENETVSRGDVLFSIDPQPMRSRWPRPMPPSPPPASMSSSSR